MYSSKLIFIYGSFLLLLASNSGVLGQNRIIGGTETDISRFPFLIAISLYGAQNHPLCGASIISKDWAVSAGHCFILPDPSLIKKYLIISGTTYTREKISQDKKPPKYHNITEHHVHEKFKGEGKDFDGYDIAVFKVDPPFEFDELTQPAILPKSHQKITAKHANIAGWGCTELHGSTNPNLLYANVTKLDTDDCLEEYYSDTIKHKNSVLCYGPKKSDKKISNMCQGDSGGPLIINGKMVAGVVSLSKPNIKVPGMFSSTAYYRDWIKKKTGV